MLLLHHRLFLSNDLDEVVQLADNSFKRVNELCTNKWS